MPLERIRRFRREDIRANPGKLYVFGDNMARRGLGGQARDCRGEPNAVGVPTKWAPRMDPAAFFSDDDLLKIAPEIRLSFERINGHLKSGGVVCWPEDGIGTGLAELSRRAPAIWTFLQGCIEDMEAAANAE